MEMVIKKSLCSRSDFCLFKKSVGSYHVISSQPMLIEITYSVVCYFHLNLKLSGVLYDKKKSFRMIKTFLSNQSLQYHRFCFLK